MAPELWPHNHLRGWKSTIRSLNICWLWNGRFVGFQAAGLRKLPVARIKAANWQDPLCSTFAQRHHCSVSSHSDILLKMFSSQSLNNDLSDLFWVLIWVLWESLGNSSWQPGLYTQRLSPHQALHKTRNSRLRYYKRNMDGTLSKHILCLFCNMWTTHYLFSWIEPTWCPGSRWRHIGPITWLPDPFNAKNHLLRNCTFKIMWKKKIGILV